MDTDNVAGRPRLHVKVRLVGYHQNGGMTPVTRLMISNEFRICPGLADVIASWVMSAEVDDDKLPDNQRQAEPPEHWLHHAFQLCVTS